MRILEPFVFADYLTASRSHGTFSPPKSHTSKSKQDPTRLSVPLCAASCCRRARSCRPASFSSSSLMDSLGHRGREGERFAPPPPVAHGGRVLGIRTVSSALCHPNGMPGSRKPAWKREMQDALFNPNPCDSDGDAWEGVLDLQAGGAMPSDAEVLKHLGVPMTRGRDAGNILKRGRRV